MQLDRWRPRLARRRAFALAMLVATVGTIGAKPFSTGLSYKIRLVTNMPAMPGMGAGGDMVILGHGVAVGARSRIDIDSVPGGPPGPFGPGDYLLTLDSGRVVAVTPSTKSYIDGFSMMSSAMPPDMMAMATVSDVSVTVEKLGPGEAVDGRPTERYRLVAKYGLQIMGQAMTISNESEISTAQLAAINTPFSGGLPKTMATGPFADLYLKMNEARKQLGNGAAVNVVTTTSMAGPMSMTLTQTMQITDIKSTNVDDKLLQIPEGYSAKPPSP